MGNIQELRGILSVPQDNRVYMNNVMHTLKGLSHLFIEKGIHNVDVDLVLSSLK